MARLYKRIYELVISEPLIDPAEFRLPFYLNRESVGQANKNYNVSLEAKQEVISELDFEAMISKDKSSSANQIDITLKNLSERALSIAKVEGAIVILKAGYESIHGSPTDAPVQFIGQVQHVEVIKQPTDLVVRIKAADGVEMLKNQKLSYNAPVGTSVADTLRKFALSFSNVVEGHFALEDIEGEVFETGYSAFGKLSEILSELCSARDLKFSIEDNAVYIYPASWYRVKETKGIVPYKDVPEVPWAIEDSKAKEQVIRKGTLYVLTPENAISAKEIVERRSAKAGSGKGTSGISLIMPTYLKFNTQLDRIELNDEFKAEFTGQYTIESLSTSLNNTGGSWETTLELTST